MGRRVLAAVVLSLGLLAGVGALAPAAPAADLCAFRESTTASGLIATSTFHVVRDGVR